MRHRVVNAEKMNWTPDKDQQLLALFAQGLHKNDVAQKIGSSIAAAEGRYRRLLKEQTNGYQKN